MSYPGLHLDDVRKAYGTVADSYAKLVHTELAEKPLDRAALIASFAELVRSGGRGPVADLGCGPGRITAHLASLGLDAFGIDLSSEMIAVARRTYPELAFGVGSIDALDIDDHALSCWPSKPAAGARTISRRCTDTRSRWTPIGSGSTS